MNSGSMQPSAFVSLRERRMTTTERGEPLTPFHRALA
jgi:hypothetical protein